VLTETVDVARPVRDLDAQQRQLERKFRHLAEPAVGPAAAAKIIEICRTLEAMPDLAGLLALCRP
jgi:hypothetical protein